MLKRKVASVEEGQPADRPAKKRRWTRVLAVVIAALLVLLVGARAYLPLYIQDYVNRTLDRIPEYDGRIGDIDVHLFRGAYRIENIDLIKTTGKVREPFFASPAVDLSVEWRSLFRGAAVGEIHMKEAELHFVRGASKAASQTSIDDEWLQAVKDLFPFRINSFTVERGKIFYRDQSSTPKIDTELSEVSFTGTNFGNVYEGDAELPARMDLAGNVRGQAALKTLLRLDPSAADPTFKLEASLTNLELTRLNELFRAYGGFDAHGGRLSLYIDAAAADRKIKGYAKPILEGVDIVQLEEDSSNPLEFIWENLVGVVAELFENQRRDRLASKIPIEGSIDDPQADIVQTLINVLRNAFVESYKHGMQDHVDLEDVSGK